ncbi:hypothetical protein D3C87_1460370 [compost metagenome]
MIAQAHVQTDPGGGVLVLQLAILLERADRQKRIVVDGHFGVVVTHHQTRTDADRQIVADPVGEGRLHRDAEQGRLLGEVAPGPVIVVVHAQTEIPVQAETDAGPIIELMADEQAASRQDRQRVAAFVAREIIAAVALEAEVAEHCLAVEADLSALERADAGRVGHQHARVADQRRRTGIGQSCTFLADFVELNAAGQRLCGAAGQGEEYQ